MIVFILIILAVPLYLYSIRNHDYWTKRNVKHDHPIPLFGNHFRVIFGYKSITEISMELYNKYPDEKVVGYFRGTTPELIIRDLDIAKAILNVEFSYFYPRGIGKNPKVEPLHLNLFHVDGDTWKLLRQRLTPAFTSAKLKGMFPLIVNCTQKLNSLGDSIVRKGGDCDVRELMARFTTEFIGACGFGLEVDTITNENSLFRELGKLIFKRTTNQLFLVGIRELFPEIRKYVSTMNNTLELGITKIVKHICEQRNYKTSGRNDFVDLLLELQSKGVIKGESIEHRNVDGTPMLVEMEMDFKCLVAQVFVFYAAGFETSSSATSFTLHQLAYHPDIQKKIQKEIDVVLLKYNNELCYDAVAEMSFLSMAFKEAMRMFPSLGVLHRVCVCRYTIPKLNITVDSGVKIQIPIQAIQNDELYFNNPSEFRPERFANTDLQRHNFSYLPFGSGPRACIGARLGEMQSLAGLAGLLHRFSVEPTSSTQRYPEVDHWQNTVQGVKAGLPLRLRYRSNFNY